MTRRGCLRKRRALGVVAASCIGEAFSSELSRFYQDMDPPVTNG